MFYAGWIIAVVVLLVLTAGLVLARGVLLNRQSAELDQQLAQGTRVLVTPVGHGDGSRTVQIPATLHGYAETPVYAKIAGYLKSISVDKGDRVRSGQVIALLESPELDHQVANARATYDLQQITDRRNQTLRREGVIAAQAADEAHARMLEAKATLDQLTATARKLAILIYRVLKGKLAYRDPGPETYDAQRRTRLLCRLRQHATLVKRKELST